MVEVGAGGHLNIPLFEDMCTTILGFLMDSYAFLIPPQQTLSYQPYVFSPYVKGSHIVKFLYLGFSIPRISICKSPRYLLKMLH